MMDTNRIREARERLGLTQITLAEAVSVSRQTLGAIEGGKSEPSVSLALRLSEVLQVPVEELFGSHRAPEFVEVELVGRDAETDVSRVALGLVGRKWVAHPLDGVSHEAADGLILLDSSRTKKRVEVLRPVSFLKENYLIAGCAPALELLVSRLNRMAGGTHFHWIHATSDEARDWLAKGWIHAAGVHEAVEVGEDAERTKSSRYSVTLAHWTTGLVVSRGNPLSITTLEDLSREGLRLCVRPSGAASQKLFESFARARGLEPTTDFSYFAVARKHLEAASFVAHDFAQAAVSIEPAAACHGLDFVPIGRERFELAFTREGFADTRTERLCELMNSAAFRRELAALGGYDVEATGLVR